MRYVRLLSSMMSDYSVYNGLSCVRLSRLGRPKIFSCSVPFIWNHWSRCEMRACASRPPRSGWSIEVDEDNAKAVGVKDVEEAGEGGLYVVDRAVGHWRSELLS